MQDNQTQNKPSTYVVSNSIQQIDEQTIERPETPSTTLTDVSVEPVFELEAEE